MLFGKAVVECCLEDRLVWMLLNIVTIQNTGRAYTIDSPTDVDFDKTSLQDEWSPHVIDIIKPTSSLFFPSLLLSTSYILSPCPELRLTVASPRPPSHTKVASTATCWDRGHATWVGETSVARHRLPHQGIEATPPPCTS
jgi:hypothetical protein